MFRFPILVALVLLAGCANQSKPMMQAPPDMARGPLDHPPLWQIQSNGGVVQAAPEVYLVVWQGSEQIGAEATDFMGWMLTSEYWTSSLKEYGVGPGVAKGLIVLPMPPPAKISDPELRTIATSLVTSGQVTRTDNTQVAFLPDPSTEVDALGSVGCQVFAGYHDHVTKTADAVAYSVNLRCAGEAGQPIDQLTRVLSHETAEAATDPVPPTGYVATGPVQQEISDLCNFGAGLPVDVPPDATHPSARRYWLQRQYSNAVAMDGTKDPCIPLPWNRPYWNVALDPAASTANATPGGALVNARLDVFAYGDVGLIKWFASSADGSAAVAPASGEAHAGDTIPITISFTHAQRGIYEIDVESESEKAGSAAWFAYVTLQ
jgi:hypothetical protein